MNRETTQPGKDPPAMMGDVLAGTVTVKGPDGKERQTQFLGGVE